MTLPLPFKVKDSDTQANFDELAQHFPLHRKDVGNDVVVLNSTTTAKQAKISWGLIRGSDGVILAGSGDYTASRAGTGSYDITWTTAKAGTAYAIFLNCEDGPGVNVADYNAKVAASFHVQTFATNTGVLTDSTDWTFMVIDAQ